MPMSGNTAIYTHFIHHYFLLTAWLHQWDRTAWLNTIFFEVKVFFVEGYYINMVSNLRRKPQPAVSANTGAQNQPLQLYFHFQGKVLLSQLFYFLCLPPHPPLPLLPRLPPNCSRLTSEVTGMGTL